MKESDIRSIDLLDKLNALATRDAERIFKNEDFVRCSCPSCGEQEQIKEFDKNGFCLVSCPKCGSLYVSPRPTQKQLDSFYSESEANNFFASDFLAPYTASRREKIFVPRARDIAEKFAELRGIEPRIADIGAGTGIFLEELRKIWPEAEYTAIEPSEKMAQICREKRFDVICSMLEDVGESDGGFDLVTSFELFEHLSEPKRFLQKIHTLLNHGGCLYMTTLNGKGFDIQLLWENHDSISPPFHLNFSNPKGMRMLFGECGFDIISITTPGRLDWDIVEGRIREKGLKPGRFWEQVAGADEAVKENLQKWITESCLSSHICVVARKA